jgi:dihydroorotate dehydrogenase electron transfer subunit
LTTGTGSAAPRPRYQSLELAEVLWRGRGVAVLVYRQLGSPAHYPPGTFSMLWVPGLEAVPMTPYEVRPGELVYIVKQRGETTRRLVEQPPRYAGAIGPLGREFQPPRGRWLHVAGGTGVATVLGLAARAGGAIAYGARSRWELVPLEELGLLPRGAEAYYATDDGSAGYRGTVVELAERLIEEQRGFSHLSSAGPEPVICRVGGLAEENRLAYYAAPEATIRCGLGFCGRCALACTGLLLCRDGLFIDWERLGCWRRSRCGAKSAAH